MKQHYLEAGLNWTVVTTKGRRHAAPDAAHRPRRGGRGVQPLRRLAPTARRTLEFKPMSGLSWRKLALDGQAMRKEQGRTIAQMTLAANAPMMLKAGLVDGDTGAGVLASGQVVGVIDDLPTCDALLDRMVT